MGTNPQEPLTQGDERRNVLEPIGIEVLQLHLVVLQQPPKELLSRYGESPLVEESKGHDVSFGRRWLVLITRQLPLLVGRQRAEEATADEALQALRGNVGSAPRLH